MSRVRRVIGMDIGVDAIRYAVLKRGRLTVSGSVDFAGDPLKLEGDDKRHAVSVALFKLGQILQPCRGDKLSVSLSGYLTGVHILPLPPGSARQLNMILEQEALGLLPKENRDAFYYATGLLPAEGDGTRRGVVALARAEEIDFDLRKLAECGFQPDRILLGTLAWRHLPCVKGFSSDTLHIVCETGAKFTRVLFTRGGYLLAARQIPLGWGACRKVLRDHLHLREREAATCLARWLSGKPLVENAQEILPEDASETGLCEMVADSGAVDLEIMEEFDILPEADTSGKPQETRFPIDLPPSVSPTAAQTATPDAIRKAEDALLRHGGKILREVARFLAKLRKDEEIDLPVRVWLAGSPMLAAQAKELLGAEHVGELPVLEGILHDIPDSAPCSVAVGLAYAGIDADAEEADLLPEQVAIRRHDSMLLKIAAAVLIATLPLPWIVKDFREYAAWSAEAKELAGKAHIAVEKRAREKLLRAQEAQLQQDVNLASCSRERQRIHALLLAAAEAAGGGKIWIREFRIGESGFRQTGFQPGGFVPGGTPPGAPAAPVAPGVPAELPPVPCELSVEAASYAVVEDFAKALADAGWVVSIDIRRADSALTDWKNPLATIDRPASVAESGAPAETGVAAPPSEQKPADHVLVTLCLEVRV